MALITSFGYSQLTLTRHNLTPISDGQVVAYNTYGLAAEMDFYVKNTGTTTTTVKIRCQSLINNNGSGFELCFGNECLAFVEEGETYPNIPVILGPNETNGNFDHLMNTVAGTGTFPKDYTFKFYQINASGAEIGNSITMTYRFDPSLSVAEMNDLQSSGVLIKSTVVDNQLELDVLKGTTMEIYDLTGKKLITKSLAYGIQSVDLSTLPSSVYVIKFTNETGTSVKKIVKR